MNKIVFFGGKGGVGKTTVSSAFASACAKKGERTLLVSTDPAHSLCDIFERTIGAEVTTLSPNLDGLEIDPEEESQKYINSIKKNMKSIVSPVIVKEIEKQLDAAAVTPGSDESAVFDKLMEVLLELSSAYDRIVIDTAPTGHTVRLLSLPELMGGWMDRLIEKRKAAMALYEMANRDKKKMEALIMADPVISTLSTRKAKMEQSRELLTDHEQVSFVFVLNPEKLPIEETKKAIQVLAKYRIQVRDLVVNRILPDGLTDPFWNRRREIEKKYLEDIETVFAKQHRVLIPLIETEVRAEDLGRIGAFFEKQ